MKRKIILMTGFLSVAVFASGQNKNPEYLFHASTQVCHVYWATEYDYVLKLYLDSTASYIFYESEYKGGENKIIRKEYKGKYSINGDTVHIQYAYSMESQKGGSWAIAQSSFQQIPSFGTLVETKKPTIIKQQMLAPAGITIQKDWFNAPAKFIFKNKTMMPIDGGSPTLIIASSLEIETLENTFSTWNNVLGRFK